MKAFHGDLEIKKRYLDRIDAHARADEIIKGKYWQNGKGCAVGCTIHGADHSLYESKLGIPQLLARLEDGIFEYLPNELAMTWPRRFLEAIPVGIDLSNIWPQFAHWLMLDPKYGVFQFARDKESKAIIQKIGEMYLAKSQGKDISIKEWEDAYAAAYVAAAHTAAAYAASDAAVTAHYSAATTAAAHAAVAASAAAYAAVAASAAASATAYAAAAASKKAAKKSEWRIAQSEKLLELLEMAK